MCLNKWIDQYESTKDAAQAFNILQKISVTSKGIENRIWCNFNGKKDSNPMIYQMFKEGLTFENWGGMYNSNFQSFQIFKIFKFSKM